MHHHFPTSYSAPFHLFRASAECQECGISCQVIGLTSGTEEPFILQEIKALPEELLSAIIAVHANFELCSSRKLNSLQFLNACSCSAHFPEFPLFSLPGGAFFPTEEGQASQIEVIELPIHGEHEIECSYGIGTGGLILKHGKRINWDSLT